MASTYTSDVTDDTSVCSLDVKDMLSLHGDQVPDLLSESVSLSSSSDSELEDVPSFPAGRRPPLTTVLRLDAHLPLFPNGLERIGNTCTEDECTPTLLAATTPPRLRRMLKETLCIRQWAESITSFDAPGHIPWASSNNTQLSGWIPEGSIFPPEEFNRALCHKRRQRHHNSRVLSGAPDTSFLHPATPSFREALVFEREISLGPSRDRKRWSLQVPAAKMDPEVVNMVLELQDLNSYFRNGGEEPSQPPPPVRDNTLVTPVLMVSDSVSAIPISASTSLEAESALATRRGRKAPTPLDIKSRMSQDPYPSIPTAFLDPSGRFLRSEAPIPAASSMGLEEMIKSLRSKCYSMDPFSGPGSPESLLSTIMPIDDDEWAFVKELDVSFRQDNPVPIITASPAAPIDLLTPQSIQDINADRGSPVVSSILNSEALSGERVAMVDFEPAKNSNMKTTAAPPSIPNLSLSTPLPPRPALSSLSSRTPTRGILKSPKVVRFASLPSRKENLLTPIETPVETPRRSLRSNIATASNSVSPMKPVLPSVHLRAVRSAQFRSQSGGAASPRATTPQTTKTRLYNRPASAPLSTKQSVIPPPPLPSFAPVASTLRPQSSKSSLLSVKTARHNTPSVGRHSVGGPGTAMKENRPRAISSPLASSRRSSSVNENVARRDKYRDSTTSKSLVPVPLRNILTRFK